MDDLIFMYFSNIRMAIGSGRIDPASCCCLCNRKANQSGYLQWNKWFRYGIQYRTNKNISYLVPDGNGQLVSNTSIKSLQVQTNGAMMTSTTTATSQQSTGQQMLVIDARSYTSAWANKYKGGGFESTGKRIRKET